jgi:hypothetical protein
MLPIKPPVYETTPSDIPNPDAPVTASVASPTGTMPPVSEAASSAATIEKNPNSPDNNPILKPSEKLRFSDNVLEVTLKLTNPTEQRIHCCEDAGANANINQRYKVFGTLGPKATGSISFMPKSFKRDNYIVIRTMHTPDRNQIELDQWNDVWPQAIGLGLTTYNKLKWVFEAKPEITPTL